MLLTKFHSHIGFLVLEKNSKGISLYGGHRGLPEQTLVPLDLQMLL